MTTQGNPLVSVIVTSFNRVQWLGEAIESVVHQRYDNIEAIVVDDGSSDSSPELIKQMASQHGDRVKPLLLKRNIGVARARNAALEKCKGDYICNLDGDDCYLPEKIKHEVALLSETKVPSVAFSNFQWADESMQPIRTWADPLDMVPQGFILEEMFCTAFPKGSYPSYELVPREAVGSEWNDPSFDIYEDLDLKFRLAGSHHFLFNPEVSWIYRRHGRGLSAARSMIWSDSAEKVWQKNRHLLSLLPKDQQRRAEVAFKGTLANFAISAGIEAWESGSNRKAREYFRRALLLKPNRRALFLLIKCHLPAAIVGQWHRTKLLLGEKNVPLN
jgi:glycosyltransferase involved in cell wall biosynthesis